MDGFNISDFLSEQDKDDVSSVLGYDIFQILPNQGEEVEEEEEEQEHVVKFKYSESKKQKLIEGFRKSYVNDYGNGDPYHIDEENSLVNQVRNKIHAIYGNRSIVQYIEAMRLVVQVYREMYDKSYQRLVMDFPDFIKLVVSGDIPGPINHPLVRTNVPAEILLRYILDENMDANEIKNFISTKENVSTAGMVVNVPDDTGWNSPVEYEVMPELIQKRMVQSWVSGKLHTRGLDKNERRQLVGLVSLYDQVGVQDTSLFKFDEKISHHDDIISVDNLRRKLPKFVKLKSFTKEDLELARRGRLVRAILDPPDGEISPEITVMDLLNRMERNAANTDHPISALAWATKYRLYAQGIIQVKVNKYGRETHIYRDNRKVRKGKTSDAIQAVEDKAAAFRDLTQRMQERFTSLQFSNMLKEIRKEQDIIGKYGTAYFTEGE